MDKNKKQSLAEALGDLMEAKRLLKGNEFSHDEMKEILESIESRLRDALK